jgi:hypothetical protein
MRSVSTIIARLCLAFLPVFFLLTSEAQQNSPFTRFGLGEYYTNQHVISRSMGGLTAAYADGLNNNVGQSINIGNPATYSGMYVTTFDLGFTIDSRTLNSKTPLSKFNTNNFIPSYITIGIPLSKAKGLGLAFGLKPISNISYSIQTNERIAADSLATVYEGSGGMNQAFVGIGKKWKGFSIGFNTGFNFGRKEIITRKIFLNDTVNYYNAKSGTNTSFSGLFLEGGLQYEFSLHKKEVVETKTISNYLVRFGLTGTLKQNMNALQDVTKQTYVVNSTSGDIKVDSVFEQSNVKGTIALPSTYAAGITFHKTVASPSGLFEMWSIGAEYTATQWTKYRFYNAADQLNDSWQFKIGTQFCPGPGPGSGYWSSVNYRLGYHMGKDYLNPDGNGLKKYGFSFGAGLPVRKWRTFDNQFTFLNTAFEFGKRGSGVNNITESYFQVSLGMSLSDLWFIKRKYD